MKKIAFMLFAVSLNAFIFSCTPEALTEGPSPVQACCGEEGDIPPPPPPPPPKN